LLLLFVTSVYSYNTAGNLLNSITVGNITTEYTYNDDGDLANINYASGSRQLFQYNSENLLSQSEQYSDQGELISSVTFTHNWNGKLEIALQPQNRTRELFFDLSGEILATLEGGIPLFEVEVDSSLRKLIFGDQVRY